MVSLAQSNLVTMRKLAIVAVATTPLCGTAFPLASRSCTLGCWPRATPATAVADGAVDRES